MKISKGFWWLIFLFSCVFGGRMSDFDLRGDSMNYAAISNNVLYGSDPLILTLNGELYMNKPPLFFWANALFIKLFGANTFSVRLSTLIAVLVIIWFLYKIGEELFSDKNTALMVPFLFFTTYIVYKNTHMLKLEAFVSAFVAASVYFFLLYLRSGRFLHMILMGAASGLAVFSKGPLGLIVVIAAVLFPAVSRECRSGKYLMHILCGLFITVAVSAWWYAYISLKTPFFETFFMEQIADRMLNNSLGITEAVYKERPLWRYLYYVVKYGGLFLVLFPVGLYRLKSDGRFSKGVRFMFSLGVVYLIIIHCITTREHRYLYQFYLIFSFVSAYGLASLIRKDFTPFLKYAGLIFALFMVVYPGSLNWNSYGALEETGIAAGNSGLPVVARKERINNISDKAAMSFYLRDHLPEPPAEGGWFEVVEKNTDLAEGVELFRSKRVKVYLMQPDELK